MRRGRRWWLAALVATACGGGAQTGGVPFGLGAGSSSSGGVDDGSGDGDGLPAVPTGDGTGSVDGTTSGGDTSGASGSESSGGSTGATDDCPYVVVTVGAGQTLNVRPDPSTTQAPIGSLADGAIVEVLGQTLGEDVNGNSVWYEISSGMLDGWVSGEFAVCSTDEPPMINDDGWYLPLTCGTTTTVSQGNFGSTSHTGTSAYAFDFAIPLGTPLVAMASGTVTFTYAGTLPGDPCYNGGGTECINDANYVTMLHADGTQSTYVHLQSVSVGVGDVVGVGEQVGLSGTTGYSTGRHAHVARMEDCGGGFCQSIALAFNDVPGDGVPVTGQTVTSGNCP